MSKLEISNNVQSIPIIKETIKKYICPNANDQELTFFIELCKARNLNPFIKEVYLVVYISKDGKRNSSIITGKDVFTKRAQENKDFDGLQAGVILIRNKELVYQKGAFKLPGDTLVGGWADVYKKNTEYPFHVEVDIKEYSTSKSIWNSKSLTMIRKVALVQALREAYPEKLSNLYDESEISQVKGEVFNVEPDRPEIKKPVLIEEEPAKEQIMIGGENEVPEVEEAPTENEPSCSECDVPIKSNIKEFSEKFYNKVLCMPCQKIEKDKKK